MKVLLKNITINHPLYKLNKKSNILIEDGVITKVSSTAIEESAGIKVYDMTGKIAAPGFYDMHIHLREPGREDEETVVTGCNSAARGGFTGVACMPNTQPAIDSAEVINLILSKAKGHLVDVNPIAAATAERKGEVIAPIAELAEAGAVGFSDDGVAIKTARVLRRVMEYAKMFDKPVIEHCEDESLAGGAMNEGFNSTFLGLPPIPPIAEELTVMRDIMMSEYTGARLHIAHISTKGAVELVRQGKAKGINVTAEVAPHHFSLTDDSLKTYDTNFKMNPPLRTRKDVDAILEGLKDGTIDCIATDHAPHSPEEKEMEFEYAPNGIVGLETAVGLAFTELVHKKVITLDKLIEKFAINPRKILNLPIPAFEPGEKANITILDTNAVWTVETSKFLSKCRNSPFDKMLLTGKAIAAINNGMMYYQEQFIKI